MSRDASREPIFPSVPVVAVVAVAVAVAVAALPSAILILSLFSGGSSGGANSGSGALCLPCTWYLLPSMYIYIYSLSLSLSGRAPWPKTQWLVPAYRSISKHRLLCPRECVSLSPIRQILRRTIHRTNIWPDTLQQECKTQVQLTPSTSASASASANANANANRNRFRFRSRFCARSQNTQPGSMMTSFRFDAQRGSKGILKDEKIKHKQKHTNTHRRMSSDGSVVNRNKR